MMKKLTALLLCLTLLCSLSLASADVPAGWKSHRIPDSSLTVWLPADFTRNASTSRDLYGDSTAGTLTAVSASRASVLMIIPLDEDYEAPNAFERMLIGWILPWFISMLSTDEFAFDDLYTVNVTAKKPYAVLTGIDTTGDVYITCYIPLYDGMEYMVCYLTTGSAATDDDHEMIFGIIKSIK